MDARVVFLSCQTERAKSLTGIEPTTMIALDKLSKKGICPRRKLVTLKHGFCMLDSLLHPLKNRPGWRPLFRQKSQTSTGIEPAVIHSRDENAGNYVRRPASVSGEVQLGPMYCLPTLPFFPRHFLNIEICL